MQLFVCTRDRRVIRLDRDGPAWTAEPVLEDVSAQCVAADGKRAVVGTQGGGALLTPDGGAHWERVPLPEDDVLSVAIGRADGALYAGTEPSRLFVNRGDESWTELKALQEIPSRDQWSFPPRPWTHHVRWIAPDPRLSERLLVGIELGGLMFTDDGGGTFTDHRPGAKRDTHCIAWHPAAEGRAYQAAGDGAARSDDGGLTWEPVDAGRQLRYCWALAVDPADPERWYVSAASGPGAAHAGERARGELYRWEGDAWRRLDLPGESMPYALAFDDSVLIAGMADGRILGSGDRGESWEEADVRVGSIIAMAASPRANS
jgi:photosystem II stability/assembly factor-like uncharacterized protein